MPKALAFVTGATGFVGSNLLRSLLERGVAVRALARPGSDRSSIDGLDVEVVEGDLLDRDHLGRHLRGCGVCYHLAAAYSAPRSEELYRSNVEGTRIVLEAARDEGLSAIVHASTMGTLGRPGGRGLLREEDSHLAETASHYVRSKFQAERIADRLAAEGAPVRIAHLAAPVGPWDRVPTVTGRRILSVMEGRAPAYIAGAINHVSVRDVAEGLILAAERGQTGRHYLLALRDGNLTRRAFTRLVARAAGIPAPRTSRLRAFARALRRSSSGRRQGAPATLACDPSRTVQELGLPQSPLEGAFSEAVEWFRSHPRSVSSRGDR